MKNIKLFKILLIAVTTLLVIIISFFIYNSKIFNNMTITGKNGEKIKIYNIEKLKNTEKIGDTDIILADTPEFSISYYRPDQSFAISIMSKNFKDSREKAEKNLLKILGLSSEEACKLKLTLSTPTFINAEIAGGNYGLSFCPGATPSPINN